MADDNYLAPSLRAEGYTGSTASTPYRPATSAQTDLLQSQYGTSFSALVTPARAGTIQLSINFDGTQNDSNALKPGEAATNVAELHDLLRNAGPQRSVYVSGIGTDGVTPGSIESNLQSTPFAAGAIGQAKLEVAYRELLRMVDAARSVDPNALIELNLTGFSRGGAEAVAFANLVNERGIPGVYAHGTVVINSMVLFDPVNQTNDALDTRWPANVRNSLVIVAMDERRIPFPPMPVGSNAIVIGMPGAHADIGGGFGTQGISAVSLCLARSFLDATGAPIAQVPDERLPDWTQQRVHNSALDNHGNPQFDTSAGNRYYEGSGIGSMSVQEMLVLPPGQRLDPVWQNLNGRTSLVAWSRTTVTNDSIDPETGARTQSREATVFARDGLTVTSREFSSETRDVTGQLTSGQNVTYSADGSRILSTTHTERHLDGSVVATSRDGQGTVQSTTITRVFDDGSSIATTELSSGVVRTVVRGSDKSFSEEFISGTSVIKQDFDAIGTLVSTTMTSIDRDGNTTVRKVAANGDEVTTVKNRDGEVVSVKEISGFQAQVGAAMAVVSDVTSVINAIKSGDDVPTVASGIRLLNTLDSNHAIPYLGTANTVAQGALSIYNLDQAFSGAGNDLSRVSATLSTLNYANNVILSTPALSSLGSKALSGVLNGAPGGVLQGGLSGVGALPALGLISAIKNDDPIGAAMSVGTLLQGSAFFATPAGWFLIAASLCKALESPPEAWGIGTFTFSPAGTDLVLDAQGESFGIERVRQLQMTMQDYLQDIVDQQRQANPNAPLGIIPQRLGTLTWREARQPDPGYALRDIDPLTGEERYVGLRYNDDLTPYNADATDPEQRRNLLERMVVSAIERDAIAPLWEVQTAKLQQVGGDPLAGLTEEERAARRGLLAPVDLATNLHRPGEFRPIALDLDGDGRIATIANADNDRAFDWDGSGFDKQVGWVGSGEGLLWLDRNPNGVAESGKELFSNSLLADAAKGTRSLAAVDANGDGVIDAADPVYAALKVWHDADGDAVVDAGEAKSLADLGISALDYNNNRFTRNGQLQSMQTAVLEASADGERVSVVPEGIRVEFSDGRATLYVTRVNDLGAGNDGIDAIEDGGIDRNAQGEPTGQSSSRRDPIAIAASLLLANDQIDGSNAGLAITAVGNASAGTVSLNAQTGVVEFLAPHHFNGAATFDYTVTALDGQSKVATVTVNVAAVNDRPDVEAMLPSRTIYGWGVLVQRQTIYINDSSHEEVRITPNQGEAFYAPYRTVQGQRYETPPGENTQEQPVGGPVDTGIPLNYFESEYARYPADEFGQRPAYLTVLWNGARYRVAASPATYLHDTPVAQELGNDGRVVATDADGDAQFRYEVVSQPLYGRLGGDGTADDIDPITGAFSYEGRRYVAHDEAGNAVAQNVFTDKHSRYEWDGDPAKVANWDSFTVKVVDTSDPSGNTFTLKVVKVPHFGPLPNPNVQSGGQKPIAIDVNGDGFHFTDVDDSNVFYDVNGDGWRRRIAWNNPQDGFIAFDKNGDGKISAFDELSFVPYDANGRTDLEALRSAFDSNRDGIFSAADDKWGSFGVWRDADSDGVTDEGEFLSLSQMGIASIALASNGQFQVIDGQTVHGTAVATRTDGSTLAVADVTLRYRNETRIDNPDGSSTVAPVPTYQPGSQFDGTAGADLVLGTSGSDMFRLGDGNDVVNDDLGNDGVQAGAGDDLIYTGSDNDVIDAGAGNDAVFAGVGNDLVFGDDGDDLLMLEGGNDVAFGGAGHDFIGGGDGNDAISGDAGDDKLFGEGGWDALFGKAGDDELWGMDGNDLLYGDEGNDLIVGGAGDDRMEGGAGSDTYELDAVGDEVVENEGDGSDTVRASIAYTLAATIENLTLTGSGVIDGTGNDAANVLVGNDAVNTLRGLAGDDTLDGGLSADLLIGGIGDDAYVVDNAGDAVIEAAGEGLDTVRSRIGTTLAANVENLTLLGIGAIDGTGNAADTVIVGNAAANILDGGAGADEMRGGRGDDRYIVESAGDRAVEQTGEGYDTVRVERLASYTLGDHVEALELGSGSIDGSGNSLDNVLIGNAASNRLDGLAGADVMSGGEGDDVYVVDAAGDIVIERAGGGIDRVESAVDHTLTSEVENLVLKVAGTRGTGNELSNVLTANDLGNLLSGLAGDDSLIGGAGSDVLDGGAGSDSMTGGAGDDTYVVDSSADRTIETAGGGIDSVRSSISWTLAEEVENLELTGAANLDGTGNALDNRIDGNAGDNVLDGGAGVDAMTGGAGNDTYIVDNGGDRTIEAAGGGIDTVLSSVSWTLAAETEQLVLTGVAATDGTGNAMDNTLTGNAAANVLDGSTGADALAGGAGDDIYVVDEAGDRTMEAADGGLDTVESSVSWALADNVENLVLTGVGDIAGTGNALANTITGNAGRNVLDGELGADTMAGGQGDDDYLVDDVGDRVREESGQGIDRVTSRIDYVLPQHVEQLTLTGVAVRGTGNDLDNLLFGNEQANVLDGAAGADRMAGAAGDDRYAVDDADDVIVEGEDAGIDTVVASVSYGAAANVENLVLVGAANLMATGNELANVLVGNAGANAIEASAGNDVVAGGLGDDTLDGGSGDDLYLYHQGEGRDRIVDAAGSDTLRLGAGMTLDSVAGRIVQVDGQQRVFVSILGTDGQETDRGIEVLLNADGTSPIERVELADGSTASFADVMIKSRTLNGTANADIITGDRNDDTVFTGGGADTVYGRTGHDIVYGGTHNDRLFGEGGNDRLYGESEADALWGGAGDDVLDGGSGADALMGGTGNDQLLGGVDDDVLDAGLGNDLLDGGSGKDRLFGASGDDTLRGGEDLDLLAAGDGDDVIESGTGTAVVVAGRGSDRVGTDTNADFVDAGEGDDVIGTSARNDFIVGGRGNDRIDAGLDKDIIAFNRGDGADTVVTSSWQSDALSLGGGIRYADIALRKAGNSLVLELGQGDSITLEGWYLDSSRLNIKTLQVVTASPGGDYAAGSSDRMRNRKVVAFDFEQLVARFDAAREANPALTTWSTAADLNAAYASGSDTQAIGGDMAYRYATTGSYGDLDWLAIDARLAKLGAGTWQTLTASTTVNPWTALQAGISLIADETVGLPSPITPANAPTHDELVFAAIGASGRLPSWRGAQPAALLP